MPTQKLTELDMHEPIKQFFSEKGYTCYSEVPMLSRKIDVVAVGKDIIAIELKLDAWLKALSQALAYRTVADFSYIAVPNRTIRNLDFAIFERFGIGIISFSQNIHIVKPARQCHYHPKLRDELMHRCGGVP